MRKVRIMILALIAISGCATQQTKNIVIQEKISIDIESFASNEEIFQELKLCADGKQSAEVLARSLSLGNEKIYEKIFPKIELYVKQKVFNDIATMSFAKFIRITMVELSQTN